MTFNIKLPLRTPSTFVGRLTRITVWLLGEEIEIGMNTRVGQNSCHHSMHGSFEHAFALLFPSSKP